MAIIKCSSCGHRHFQVVPLCINCGASLSQWTDGEQWATTGTLNVTPHTPHESSTPSSNDSASYERFLVETPDSQSIEEPEHDRPHSKSEAPSRQLVRREEFRPAQRQVWKKKNAIQPYQSYETAMNIAAPHTFAQPASMILVKENAEQVINPESWHTDRLPWYFPKIRPSIVGTVIHMESREEVIDYPDLLAAIATLLVELVWVMTDTVQHKESDRVVMTTVRVQTYTGALKDTRLRGNMRGANLSLGDQVSLWGVKRRGVLLVKRGFNHTTQGAISTTSLGLIVPALIIMATALIGIYFASTWFPIVWHHLLSFVTSYFSFFHQHPITPPIHKKK